MCLMVSVLFGKDAVGVLMSGHEDVLAEKRLVNLRSAGWLSPSTN